MPLINIYHCCIQKSASQWFLQLLRDDSVKRACSLEVFSPHLDFTITTENRELLRRGFPGNAIVSPLYIPYEEFLILPKPPEWKAFYVVRDPRDILISWYFSVKCSHVLNNAFLRETNRLLRALSLRQGLDYMIANIEGLHREMYAAMHGWLAAGENEKVLLVRYEDATGDAQLETMERLFDHLGIGLSRASLTSLLRKYSFARMSRGRERGDEDAGSHYRKGLPGDWKKYLHASQQQAVREKLQGILTGYGYEYSADNGL